MSWSEALKKERSLMADIKIYAFALMANHAHILLKSGKTGITNIVRLPQFRFTIILAVRGITDIP
jgi:hypothetical protein